MRVCVEDYQTVKALWVATRERLRDVKRNFWNMFNFPLYHQWCIVKDLIAATTILTNTMWQSSVTSDTEVHARLEKTAAAAMWCNDVSAQRRSGSYQEWLRPADPELDMATGQAPSLGLGRDTNQWTRVWWGNVKCGPQRHPPPDHPFGGAL